MIVGGAATKGNLIAYNIIKEIQFLTRDLDVDVARVGLVAAVEGGAGVVALVGVLGGGRDGERAVGEHLLAPVARQLVAVCK